MFADKFIGEYMDKCIGKTASNKPAKSTVDVQKGKNGGKRDSDEKQFTSENYKNDQTIEREYPMIGEQYIRDSMRLGIALQLKLEGYETVAFNRVVEGERGRFIVDVFAEDCFGNQVAVFCVLTANEANEGRLNDLAITVVDALGDDCFIAIAFHLRLINFVKNAIGIANWIYLVDHHGRVWRHDPNMPYRSAELAWEPSEKPSGKMVLQPEGRTSSSTATKQDFYVI